MKIMALMCLFSLAGCSPSYAVDPPKKAAWQGGPSSMALQSVSGSPGTRVEMPLMFYNGQPQITSIEFDVVMARPLQELVIVQATLSSAAQDKYKQLTFEPKPFGAHIVINSWHKHPYYRKALFFDGELVRLVIAIPPDTHQDMGGHRMQEGYRMIQITNIKAMDDNEAPTPIAAFSGFVTVLQPENR